MRQRILAGIVLGLAVANVTAAPIAFTETALISGSLNGVPFEARTLTLRASGDTQYIVHSNDFLVLSVHDATFDIAGVGSGTFTYFTRVWNRPQLNLGGFTTTGPNVDFRQILSLFAFEFFFWDLARPIGPITGDPFFFATTEIPTSRGPLFITNSGQVTFTAVPIPTVGWLLVPAFGVLGWKRQRITVARTYV